MGERSWVAKAFKQVVGQHAVFYGATRTLAQLALKVGAKRAAIGVATTGITGLTVRNQLKEVAERGPLHKSETLADNEELEWINVAIKPLWDHLNAGLRRFIVEDIEPRLQSKVPVVGWLLRFKRLTLGTTAPRLGPLTVTRSTHFVDFNVAFEFSGDMNVEFSAGLASIGLEDVRLSGAVQIRLGPMMDALNPCGGLTISCLDRPKIDLKIRSSLTDVVPNLYDFVRDTVDDAVAGALVVPNGVAIVMPTFGTEVPDFVDLRYRLPKGLLRIHLCELSFGSSQASFTPYVRGQVGASVWQSPVGRIHEGGFAQWFVGIGSQDFFVFSENQTLELQVFRETFGLGLDSLMGRARVMVRDVVGAKALVEVELTTIDGVDVGSRLSLRGEWLGVSKKLAKMLPAPFPPQTQPVSVPTLDQQRRLRPSLAPRVVTAGDTAGGADSNVLVSVRVDAVSGLPEDADVVYYVRAILGDRAQVTTYGVSPGMPEDSMTDEMLMTLVRRLLNHLRPEELAPILGLAKESVQQLSNASGTDESWDAGWCQRARAKARDLAASRNPQFEQVLHMPTLTGATLRLEVVRKRRPGIATNGGANNCEKSTFAAQGEAVVASLERDLFDIASQGGCLPGPFQLDLQGGDLPGHPETSARCMLKGSVQLRLLELHRPGEVFNFSDVEAEAEQPFDAADEEAYGLVPPTR